MNGQKKMTLEELRTYYKLREYQISHLINARKCHKSGVFGELNMYMFLFYWADAMHQADEMRGNNLTAFIEIESWVARGLK
jgi:hypothetical protein